jgi:uncharacterized protein (DUF1778 family)
MGNYSNALKRELGKNTGKWLSNQIFGNGHATPIRVSTSDKNNELRRKEKEAIKKQRDFEKNKIEREKMRLQEKKLELKYREQREIARAKEQKRLEKEEQEELKQELIDSNAEELSASLNYLQVIQDIHKVEPSEFDLDQYTLIDNRSEYIKNNWSAFYHKDDYSLDYIDSLMILSCLAASADTRKSISGKKFSTEEAEELLKLGQVLGLNDEEIAAFWNYLDNPYQDDLFQRCCKTLNNGPIFLRFQALAFVKKMVFATTESGSSSISGTEDKFIDKVVAALKISPSEYLLANNFSNFNFISKSVLYNFNYLSNHDLPSIEFDLESVFQSMEKNRKWTINFYKKQIAQFQNDINKLKNKPSNKDWETEAADICIKEIRIISDLEMILEEVKTNIIDKTPKFIIKFFKEDYLGLLKGQINKKAKKIQQDRIAEKHKLLNSEPYLTYTKLTQEIIKIENKIEDYQGSIKSIENAFKNAKSQIEKDSQDFNNKNLSLWKDFKASMLSDFELSSLISKVKKGDQSGVKDLLKTCNILSFLEEFGCEYLIESKKDHTRLDIILNTSEVVPTTKMEIRKNGLELVDKAIATSEYNLILQDFMCSVVLRSANEIFANVPNLNQFEINVFDNLLNSAKGIIEEVKLIEVTIDKINFSKLRLSKVDPSDALENFKPKMKFSRSSGFKTLN